MTGGIAFSTPLEFSASWWSRVQVIRFTTTLSICSDSNPHPQTRALADRRFGMVITGSTFDVRDNIFANNITGGTTSIAHVAVYLPSGGTSAMNLTDNNNSYYRGTDAVRQGVGQAGTTAGTNFYTTLAALAAYSSTLHAAATNDNASIRFDRRRFRMRTGKQPPHQSSCVRSRHWCDHRIGHG